MKLAIVIILIVTYLLLGTVMAYYQVPSARENTDDEQMFTIWIGVIILAWLPIIIVAIIIGIPKFIIKLHERNNE